MGTRKKADRPSMPTLKRAPGIDQGHTIGWLSPLCQNVAMPPRPSPVPSTATSVATHWPAMEVFPQKRPARPLDAATMIPTSTSDSLMSPSYPVSQGRRDAPRLAQNLVALAMAHQDILELLVLQGV